MHFYTIWHCNCCFAILCYSVHYDSLCHCFMERHWTWKWPCIEHRCAMPFGISAELFDLLSGTCDSTVPSHSQGQIKVKPHEPTGPCRALPNDICRRWSYGEATVEHAGHLDQFKLAAPSAIFGDARWDDFPACSIAYWRRPWVPKISKVCIQELMILSDQVISGVYISTEEPWPSGLEHGVKLWETYRAHHQNRMT